MLDKWLPLNLAAHEDVAAPRPGDDITTFNRVAVIATTDIIVIITTINRIVIITTINRIAHYYT